MVTWCEPFLDLLVMMDGGQSMWTAVSAQPSGESSNAIHSGLVQVADAVGAGALFFNRRYEPAMSSTDAKVADDLAAAGLLVNSYSGFLLQEPWLVKVSWQTH
jgi:hypothetical protein